MEIKIELPHVGESVTEAIIDKWLIKIDEPVKKYDPILEIITDKVSMEIPSPYSGKLISTLVNEGETVKMGNPIAVMEISDNDYKPIVNKNEIPDDSIIGTFSDGANVGPTGGEFLDTSILEIDSNIPNSSSDFDTVDDDSKKYSPIVIRLAKKHGINLNDIKGSGNNGRITKVDVTDYLDKLNITLNTSNDNDDIINPNPLRKIIAERMKISFSEIPHAWSSIEIDMTNIKEIIDLNKERILNQFDLKLTYLPFSAIAVSNSLKENKFLNSSWDNGKIILHKNINLGIAMAGKDGLVVPVIKNSDNLSFLDLCKNLNELTEKARTANLDLSDMKSGTFTLNNTGALGSVIGGAIINYPQAAIVTTESVIRRPTVIESNGIEEVQIRSIMNLCLSFDHRIIDGAEAAFFLQSIKKNLESFDKDYKII